MGRHHSFLDSLKDIGHKVEHTFTTKPPIIASLEGSVNNVVNKVGSGVNNVVNNVGSGVNNVVSEVGNDINVIQRKINNTVNDIGNDVGKGLDMMKYVPFVAGAIAILFVYNKLK